MEQYYSNERNVQLLVSLLKQYGIKRIVISPGSTNVTFVGSVQQDPFFELYSCVDERSAAYMACGMAMEKGEVVALSCTGATASRNYFSALTEAFYRKIPVLVITSSQDLSRIGHLIPQVIDRSQQPLDTVKMSVHLQNIKDADDEWDCMIKINKALSELDHHGKGPVHINLSTKYSPSFNVKRLPKARRISRISYEDSYPDIVSNKVAVFVGSHKRFTEQEIVSIDAFCEKYNSVVFVDPTSNYTGKYKVPYSLVAAQQIADPNRNPELLIHIGEMSDMASIVGQPKQVWRVSEDGEFCDRFHALTCVFETSELNFFSYYSRKKKAIKTTYYESCMEYCNRLWGQIPNLPFSHIWVASQMHSKFPKHSTVHLGILSPLRSWSFFPLDNSIETYCNQGGFGIDGNMSSLVGASIVSPERLFFGIVGDLSFFYDINCLGNRHIGPNVRILLINNSLGAEFTLYKQLNSIYVNDVPLYISAAGHNGNQSPILVKHFAEALGFEYYCASSKEEYEKVESRFTTSEILDKPLLFEVFIDASNENDALYELTSIVSTIKSKAKSTVLDLLHGEMSKSHEKKYSISKKIFK